MGLVQFSGPSGAKMQFFGRCRVSAGDDSRGSEHCSQRNARVRRETPASPSSSNTIVVPTTSKTGTRTFDLSEKRLNFKSLVQMSRSTLQEVPTCYRYLRVAAV